MADKGGVRVMEAVMVVTALLERAVDENIYWEIHLLGEPNYIA